MRYSLEGTVVDIPKRAWNIYAIPHGLGAQLLTSPDTIVTTPKDKDMTRTCLVPHRMARVAWPYLSLEQSWKNGSFAAVSVAARKKRWLPSTAASRSTMSDRQWDVRKRPTVPLYLNELPGLKLKVSILKSDRCKVSHKGIPSNRSMAPCRSHHGDHTRLERINKVIHRELNPIHAKPEKIVT